MAKGSTPAVSGTGPTDWYTSLDLHIHVELPDKAGGGRRVHAPHFSELIEHLEAETRKFLADVRPTPYVVNDVTASGSYGYGFDVVA